MHQFFDWIINHPVSFWMLSTKHTLVLFNVNIIKIVKDSNQKSINNTSSISDKLMSDLLMPLIHVPNIRGFRK